MTPASLSRADLELAYAFMDEGLDASVHDDALDSLLDSRDLSRWLHHARDLSTASRQSLRDQVKSLLRDTRRASAVHHSHVSSVLKGEVPLEWRARLQPVLEHGALYGSGDWWMSWAVHRFPIGPNHIPACADGPSGNAAFTLEPLVRLCLVNALEPAIKSLGWSAAVVAMSGAKPRQSAAFLAALSDEDRHRYLTVRDREPEEPDRELRLRLQSDLLNLGSSGVVGSEMVATLGLSLLLLAGGRQFAEEASFVVHRLPRWMSAWSWPRRSAVFRRPPVLWQKARRMVNRCLDTSEMWRC